MLLADARLPTGGHANSAGLEPAIAGGMNPLLAPTYLIDRARTTSLIDAGVAVVTRHQLKDQPLTADLGAVIAHWAARTPSAAQRASSRHLGRGYLRLANRVWGDTPALLACAVLGNPPRPVVVGAIAAATNLDPIDLVRLIVYEDAQAAGSALLKLEPTDPGLIVEWVLAACQAAEDLVFDIAALHRPVDIPADGTPQAEGWVEAHALMTQRLFRA